MRDKVRVVGYIWKALRGLSPRNVADEAGRSVRLAVVGHTQLLQDTAAFLLGDKPEAYDTASESLLLIGIPPDPGALALLSSCDVVLVSDEYHDPLPGIPTERLFRFVSVEDLPETIKEILKRFGLDYAHIPLAKAFAAFRAAVALQTIQSVSIENAVFVTSTALGNVIPNPLQPLASVAESVGDLVVLTANQIRMLFRLAAIHGRDVGIRQQSPEVLSIVGAAFGWRSIARELVSKIPFGGGVVPKAAIAFAGTWAVGESIACYYSTGRRLTREQIKERFDAAMEHGRVWAEQFIARVKSADEAIEKLRDEYFQRRQ